VNGGGNYEWLVVIKLGYMLERLSIRHYSLSQESSDNVFGAENQQGRPSSNVRNPQRLHAERQLKQVDDDIVRSA